MGQGGSIIQGNVGRNGLIISDAKMQQDFDSVLCSFSSYHSYLINELGSMSVGRFPVV